LRLPVYGRLSLVLSILQFALVLLPTAVVQLDTKNPFFRPCCSGDMTYVPYSCTKEGVFTVNQLNPVIRTYPKPTLVTTVTCLCYLNRKFGLWEICTVCPRFLHKREFFAVGEFICASKIYLKQTPVTTVVKIWKF